MSVFFVLYALIMAFSFTTLSIYIRFKDLELRYACLARVVALEGARAPEPTSPPQHHHPNQTSKK
ncbi:DUF2304 family protein [Mycobacterium leprae]|uniref:DUF2304 family protein n=1 Tax=Mycobacterium leprae TaxID=1769 RepID=UPI003B8A891F